MRSIRDDERFQEERDALEPDTRRFDEIIRGVDIFLARTPELGRRITDRLYAIPTADGLGLPEYVIFYSFDAETVVRHSIQRAADWTSEDSD